MAFNFQNLKPLSQNGQGTPDLWVYSSTDAIATITGAGYFNSAFKRLNEGDVIIVSGNTGASRTTHTVVVDTVVTTAQNQSVSVSAGLDITDSVLGSESATATSQGLVFIDQPITISNNSSDTEHDIDFSAGSFSFDDGTGQAYLASITKQIDAVWAQGNNAGGLDTGVVSNDTWYYSFAIYNPTTEDSDILLSLSPDSPTLPTGYTKKKRLTGCFFKTNASSNIIQFSMHGNTLTLKSDNVLFAQGPQTGSTGVVSNAFPNVFCSANVSLFLNTTAVAGFSSLSVWGNEGFQPTSKANDADRQVAYCATNNYSTAFGFATGGGGTVISSDGQLLYRNWEYSGGVAYMVAALISVSDLG